MKVWMTRITISVSMFMMIAAFQNCGRPGDVAAIQPMLNSAQISQLKNSILSMSQADVSCTQDSDCTVLSLPVLTGCGPQEYWVTSKNNVQIPQAQALANQLAQEELDLANQNGTVFECNFIMPPAATCQQNVCAPAAVSVAGNP